MQDLSAAREKFAAEYHECAMNQLTGIGAELSQAVALIDDVRSRFAAIYQHEMRNGFTPPHFLGALPATTSLKALLERLSR